MYMYNANIWNYLFPVELINYMCGSYPRTVCDTEKINAHTGTQSEASFKILSHFDVIRTHIQL